MDDLSPYTPICLSQNKNQEISTFSLSVLGFGGTGKRVEGICTVDVDRSTVGI